METKKRKTEHGRVELSKSLPFLTTMKNMERQLPDPALVFPKTVVSNSSSDTAGFTLGNQASTVAESTAELEVLKAIINREGYISRLKNSARTISKKFKPDIPDILDFVRAASIDVVEMIVKWREAKKDHDAVFIWNGVNYLLKMPSDLDFLADYRVIKKWMGFQLTRNPFCVPYPMEQGAGIFVEKALDPQHVDAGQTIDGFAIGGLTQAKLKKKYAPGGAPAGPAYGSTAPLMSKSLPNSRSGGSGARLEGIYGLKKAKEADERAVESFVLNNDMVSLRQAELVILKEEEKFGLHCRDLEGRVVPLLQAATQKTEMELSRDDFKPLTEPSLTQSHAPHAVTSDIGLAEEAWVPQDTWVSKFANAEITKHTDDSVAPRNRGETKIGGHLQPIETRFTESRERRPLIPSITSSMEFSRFRKKKSLGDRLAEISVLRKQIMDEKDALDEEEKNFFNDSLKSPQRVQSQKKTRTGLKPLTSSSSSAKLSRSGSKGGAAGTIEAEKSPPHPKSTKDKRSRSQGTLPLDDDGEDLGSVAGSIGEGSVGAGSVGGASVGSNAGGSVGGASAAGGSVGNASAASSAVGTVRSGGSKESRGGNRQDMSLDEIRALENEERIVADTLKVVEKRDHKFYLLKEQERTLNSQEKSREIERKRRLLTAEQGVRRGPPPKDAENIYDYFTTLIQKIARGFLAKQYLKRYRLVCTSATTTIQSLARGFIVRNRLFVFRRETKAATDIQRNYRGWKSRGSSAALAKESNSVDGAIVIQRVWRGVLGRRRCLGKRALDAAAKEIRDCVDPRNLFTSDVKDLAKRIQYAVEEPLTTSFPPDEVLHLLRLSSQVMQGSRGMVGLAEYTFINTRNYVEVDGESMTWELAYKMLNRSERFIRMIRAMAHAPSAKPPRLISVPNTVQLAYAALLKNPNWCLETFENIGPGSKLCCQLFKWLVSIVEIAIRQQEFLSFLSNTFPDWLPKYFDLQREIRMCQFKSALDSKCMFILKEAREKVTDDSVYRNVLGREIAQIRRDIAKSREDMLEYLKQQNMLRDDQGKREDFAMTAMEVKKNEMLIEVRDLSKQYQDMARKASEGDKRAQIELAGLRAKLTMKQMNATELDSQFKMLNIQCGQNRARRKEDGNLLPEIRIKATSAGESKAMFILAGVKAKVFLKCEGTQFPEDLEPDKLRIYKSLKAEEDRCWAESRNVYVVADSHRQEVETKIMDSLHEIENQETQSKNKVIPSEAEMEEERREDELEARMERFKKRQYVPDFLLKAPLERPRPVIICLARDLPAFSRKRIHQEITAKMPGLFIPISIEQNMGLDLVAMQAVLDTHKSIIMMVDHGLTRLSRSSFLKTLELMTNALIPNPFVVVAMGDDGNKRLGFGDPHYGCDKNDLAIMKDGDIKICLEGMAWSIYELSTPQMQGRMLDICSQVLPPSPEFLVVAEALYVLQSESESFFNPEKSVVPLSWRAMQPFLSQPRTLVSNLKAIRRGKSSSRRVEVLASYMEHDLWPAMNSQIRKDDPLTHIMANFVEQWTLCEGLTRERGGIPLSPLTKGSLRGIQTVVIVSDVPEGDPEDLTNGGESTLGWRMATCRLMRTALQDLRVYKAAKKIDGNPFNIAIYREGPMIYFDAYDPSTSQLYMHTIRDLDLPLLLTPSTNPNAMVTHREPPQTHLELYQRLANLLHMKKVVNTKSSRKMLQIHRDFHFLQNLTCKMNGHFIHIKCYEAALGELVFKAYLPEFSATVEFTVSEEVRFKLYENCDPQLEKHVSDTDNGRLLLPFVLDRLKLSPTKPMVVALGCTMTPNFAKKNSPITQIRSQGLALSLNTRSGVGRTLLRKIVHFCNIPHFLLIKTSTATKTMRIIAYEPRTQSKIELRISGFMRKMVTGSVSDNVMQWGSKLIEKLKVVWRGSRSLVLDLLVYKSVHKIAGKRVLVSIELRDEDSLKLVITDTTVAVPNYLIVSKEQVIRLIHYVPPPKTIGVAPAAPSKSKGIMSSLTSLIGGSTTALDAAATTDVDGKKTREVDPSLFLSSMEHVLQDKATLAKLAKNLEIVVEAARGRDGRIHYLIHEPCKLEFLIDKHFMESRKETLNADLRHFNQLVPRNIPEDGTALSILRARKQRPLLHMESELNALAEFKSKDAASRNKAHHQTSLEVKAYLESLESMRARNLAAAFASHQVAESLVNQVDESHQRRKKERAAPGTTQQKLRENHILVMSGDGNGMVEVDKAQLTPEYVEIITKGEKVVYESGIKANFRDHKSRWTGHVSVKVFESVCWYALSGPGRRLRFLVFDPSTSSYYDGLVRNSKHLREILGIHGQDLMDKSKTSEMVPFIVKFRMFLGKVMVDENGELLPHDAPVSYKVEFETDRLFTEDKVTPLDAGQDEDIVVNKSKLIESELARGKKLLRMARRISGLLMHVVLFEITTPEESKAVSRAKIEAAAKGRFASAPSSDGSVAGKTAADGATANSLVVHQDSVVDDYAENRVQKRLPVYDAPTIRVIGFDPVSKIKTTLVVPSEAVMEVAGGVYSPYLDESKRRDLAKIIVEALFLVFPRGKPFEMMMHWSGTMRETTAAVVAAKGSWRSTADRTVKRPGKIFRSIMRISRLELVVTMYVQPTSVIKSIQKHAEAVAAGGDGVVEKKVADELTTQLAGGDAGHYLGGHGGVAAPTLQLVCNFYSTAASEAAEMVVTDEEQIARIGKTILKCNEGSIRAAAARRLCRFFRAQLNEDIKDPTKKILTVELQDTDKGFLNDFAEVGAPAVADTRPVGVPAVFMPLDTCGYLLHRRGMDIPNKDKAMPNKDYLVSVHTKSASDKPDKGLVIKIYERDREETVVLHLGGNVVSLMCIEAGEPNLLRDINYAIQAAEEEDLDDLEAKLESLTDKGDFATKSQKLMEYLCDIVLPSLGVFFDPNKKIVPYLRCLPRGMPPV